MTRMKRGFSAADYLNPDVPEGLDVKTVKVIDARSPDAAALAIVVNGDPWTFDVPIVPWPQSGSRPLDPGTGAEGGVTEGRFITEWVNARLMSRNEAVDGHYVVGFAVGDDDPPTAVDLWHLNYHPDGGQLFASADGTEFLIPAVPPGDDPDLDRAVALYSDGSFALCLLPSVWHEGVYALAGQGSFITRQGRVHARVSADLGHEFGCLLRVPLRRP